MKVIFLGTNGWYSSPSGDTTCVLIDAKDQYVILDAGNGIYKLDQYITEDKPISLFISHFHIDHVSGLHILNKFSFKQGIDVFVGEGRFRDFNTLVNPPFTIGWRPQPENIADLNMEIRIRELTDEEQNIPFKVAAIKQQHAYVDHGFRLNLEGKIIAYTGDCAFTDASRKLAEGADLLICECGAKKITEPDVWGHFDPYLAATLAKESNAKKLILNHFGANTYLTLDDRVWAEKEAQKIFPNTTAAVDGLHLSI